MVKKYVFNERHIKPFIEHLLELRIRSEISIHLNGRPVSFRGIEENNQASDRFIKYINIGIIVQKEETGTLVIFHARGCNNYFQVSGK